MNLGKKLILAGVLSVQAFSISAETMELDASNFNKENIQSEIIINTNDINNNKKMNFRKPDGSESLSLRDLIKEEKSGVYLNPFKEDQIMVVSFKDFKEMGVELEKVGRYNNEMFRRYAQAEKLVNDKSFHVFRHPSDNYDYNFISMSSEESTQIQDYAEKKGYSKNLIDILPIAVFFHEAGHSNDYEGNNKIEVLSNFDSMSHADKLINVDEVLEKTDKIAYIGENFGDASMLLNLSRFLMEEGKGNQKETFNELSDFFINELRIDNIVGDSYNPHSTKATLTSMTDFINNHWEMVGGLSIEQGDQVISSVINGTINQPEIIGTQLTMKDQQKSAREGGLTKKILSAVSNRVNKVMDSMITEKNGVETFEYEANAHGKSMRNRLRNGLVK